VCARTPDFSLCTPSKKALLPGFGWEHQSVCATIAAQREATGTDPVTLAQEKHDLAVERFVA